MVQRTGISNDAAFWGNELQKTLICRTMKGNLSIARRNVKEAIGKELAELT